MARAEPASPAQPEADAGLLCVEAIALVERAEAIPRNLLGAIAQAESGRPVAEDRVGGPWPWTVTTAGTGLFFRTKDEAMQAAAEALAIGQNNVDVGCLQINLGHHPDAFMTLEEAFDPLANAAYGAAFLRALFMETGSWPEAVGRYHSATPARNSRYRARVLDFWNQDRGVVPRAAALAAPPAESPPEAPDRGVPRGAPASPRFDAGALGEIKSRLGELAPGQ
jgi:soluble lytic murein transglycosylase-like protein